MKKANLTVVILLITGFLIYKTKEAIGVSDNCPKGTAKQNNNYKIEVTPFNTLTLRLDSTLLIKTYTMVQYNEVLNELIVNDENFAKLLFYSLNNTDKDILSKKVLNFSGIARNKIQGFYYKSKDSIFLYDYSNHSLYITNSSQKLIRKMTFEDESLKRSFSKNPSLPFVSNLSPLVLRQNQIFGIGFIDGEHEKDELQGRTVRTQLDLVQGNINYDIIYPSIYEKHNWGGSMFRSVYSCYNYDKNLYVISFPADHNITVVNERNEITSYPAYSIKNDVCNHPLTIKKSDLRKQKRDFDVKYFLDNVSYRGIAYDKYNKLYYRFTEIPSHKKNELAKFKKNVIIVLDDAFQYISEFELPNNLSVENFFITPNGIFFLNINNRNENIAQYEQYKITKVNSDITLSNK